MSQIIKDLSSGPVPPSVATTYVTDVNSPAVPAANILNVLGADTTANNDNGIRTDGSSGSNTLTVQLTNRATGAVTTANATPTAIITLPLAASGTVYSVTGTVTVRVPATGAGASYDFSSAMKTDGATATEIGSEYPTTFEDASLATADITVSASGNNFVLSVIGVAATTINWDAYLTYRQVS